MNKDFLFVEQAITDIFQPVSDWKTRKTRSVVVSVPRQIAHWTCYFYTKHGLADIGFYFGRRSACLMANSVKCVNALIESDYDFSCNIRSLVIHLRNSGYSVINPYGRVLFSGKKNLCTYPTEFARPPIKRKQTKSVLVPNLRQTLIQKRKQFVSDFDVLEHKRRQISHTTDLDKVITLAREISAIEIKMSKSVKQHTK